MDQLVKTFALHCGLSLSQYWHLRLVLSVWLGLLLAIGYLILSGWRKPPRPTYTYLLGQPQRPAHGSARRVASPKKAYPSQVVFFGVVKTSSAPATQPPHEPRTPRQ